MKTLIMALVLVLVPLTSRASEEYDPFKGYGTHSLRLGLEGGSLSGTLPGGAANAGYAQRSLSAVFSVMAFAEPTVFGTLLGIELTMGLGARTVDNPSGVADPDSAAAGVKPTGKLDFEFTYDLVRWKLGALRQRVIINAGGGFDYNSHPWSLVDGGSGWRAYPLLGGHFQTAVSQVVVDLTYRFVPTQTKDGVGAEHRFLAGLGIGQVVVGADYVVTELTGNALGPLAQSRFGGFAAWAF